MALTIMGRPEYGSLDHLDHMDRSLIWIAEA
jgi:hypothetical protein